MIHMGMGQSYITRGPQVFVLGSIYQGSIFGTHFGPTAIYSHVVGIPFDLVCLWLL